MGIVQEAREARAPIGPRRPAVWWAAFQTEFGESVSRVPHTYPQTMAGAMRYADSRARRGLFPSKPVVFKRPPHPAYPGMPGPAVRPQRDLLIDIFGRAWLCDVHGIRVSFREVAA